MDREKRRQFAIGLFSKDIEMTQQRIKQLKEGLTGSFYDDGRNIATAGVEIAHEEGRIKELTRAVEVLESLEQG